MRLLLVWLLLWGLAAALPGDKEALSGDYSAAQQAYQAALQQGESKPELLSRLITLAQIRNDLAASQRLVPQIVALKDPGATLRMHLAVGAISYRLKDLDSARKAFAAARPLASALAAQGHPSGALALFECNSYDYFENLARQGQPENPIDYAQANQKAIAPLMACARLDYTTLDVLRSLYWTRVWIWQAWEYSYLAFRLQDQIRAGAWTQTSTSLGMGASQAYYAAYQQTQNNELGIAAIHCLLEVAEGFPLWVDPKQLEGVGPVLEQAPTTQEWIFLRGRYQRAWGRYQYFRLKNPTQALVHFQKAADQFGQGGFLVDQMDMWLETGYDFLLHEATPGWESTVESNLQKLVEQSQRLNYLNGRFFGEGFLGVLQRRKGKLQEAETLLRSALAQVNQWALHSGQTPRARTQSLQKPEVKLFSDTLVEILSEQKRTSEAMDLTCQLNAQGDLLGLDLSKVKTRQGQSLAGLEQQRIRQQQLEVALQSAQVQGDTQATKSLQGQLASSRADFEKAVNRLRASEPDFEKVLSVRPSSFAKLQKYLPAETLMVAYYPSQDHLLTFAVSREQMGIFKSPLKRQQLEQDVAEVRRRVTRRIVLDEEVVGRLHAALIGPVIPWMAGKKSLCVIPSGALYYLPWSILSSSGGKCLAEDVAISLVTATELPDVAHYAAGSKPATLLALANPDGSLPGATREVEAVSKLFAKSSSHYGEQATKDKVKGDSDVIHIATHGLLNAADVNESYLQLASRSKLTTGEIYALDLRKVSLVTLSACETALGEGNPGSEVATLAQAFSVAGSRSMVASLWPVEDESTARLMCEFYSQLVAGTPKAEALRRAQLVVRSQPQWSHPFFWAPFQLIGDWN